MSRDKREIEEFLGALQTPALNEMSKARALEKARYAFLNSSEVPAPEGLKMWGWLSIPSLATAALLMVLIAPQLFRGRPAELSRIPNGEARMLGEMLSVFPAELKAIVANGDAPRLVLGANRTSAPSNPLVIELKKRGMIYRILSFSGEALEVSIGGETLKFEVYQTGEGAVMVVSDDLVWTSGSTKDLRGFSVQGRLLGETV